MSVAARLVRLPKGGRAIRVRVTSLLTRYDLCSTAIYLARQGIEVSRASCCRYLRRLLEEHGVEGLITIWNDAKERERDSADDAVSEFFPEF